MYHQIIRDAQLQDSAQLQKFFRVYNAELIHLINLEVDQLYRQRRATDDFDYKNILAAKEEGLEFVRELLK